MEKIGIRSKCVTLLLIDGPEDLDPWGREALYSEDGTKRIGRLTSGGYSVVFQKSIGMGYVNPFFAVEGQKLKVKIQNTLWNAVVTSDSPYDPKMRNFEVDDYLKLKNKIYLNDWTVQIRWSIFMNRRRRSERRNDKEIFGGPSLILNVASPFLIYLMRTS